MCHASRSDHQIHTWLNYTLGCAATPFDSVDRRTARASSSISTRNPAASGAGFASTTRSEAILCGRESWDLCRSVDGTVQLLSALTTVRRGAARITRRAHPTDPDGFSDQNSGGVSDTVLTRGRTQRIRLQLGRRTQCHPKQFTRRQSVRRPRRVREGTTPTPSPSGPSVHRTRTGKPSTAPLPSSIRFTENQLPPLHINPKILKPSGTDRPEGTRNDTELIVTPLVIHIDLPDTSKANPAMTRTVLTIIGGLPSILAP